MLVNDIKDLQDIRLFPHSNYALSQDIDAKMIESWFMGKGFEPIGGYVGNELMPFTGNFDGNDYAIKGLSINRTDETNVGIFGVAIGSSHNKVNIKNLKLTDTKIYGQKAVGGVVGDDEHLKISNVELVSNNMVTGRQYCRWHYWTRLRHRTGSI